MFEEKINSFFVCCELLPIKIKKIKKTLAFWKNILYTKQVLLRETKFAKKI